VVDSTVGCHVNPVPYGCLRCPLSVCVYDQELAARRVREGERRAELRERREEIREARERGESLDEIARRRGVSRMTILRWASSGR